MYDLPFTVSCPPGSYQIHVLQREVDDSGHVVQYITPECVSCPIGYYQDEQGHTTCKQCPMNYTTLISGARIKSNCIKLCSPGYFSANGVEPCRVCPDGMYSIGVGSTSCFNCSDEGKRLLCPFKDPCEKCQHLCPNNLGCACREGYTLSTDGYSCIECAKVITNFNNIPGLTRINPTWHVALCNTSDPSDALVCSGNLINDQWVITSARCVCGQNAKTDSLSLRIRKKYTCVVKENNEINMMASEIHCHPNYNSSDGNVIDLALIKMSSPLQKEEINSALPLCIKPDDIDDDSRVYLTYGLGNPTQVVSNSASLRPAFVSPASNSACFNKFLKEEIDYKNSTDVFCTNVNSGSRCTGNPGSAVIRADPAGKITFFGVISRFTKVCGKSQSYTANIKIQSSEGVLQWIDNTVTENN